MTQAFGALRAVHEYLVPEIARHAAHEGSGGSGVVDAQLGDLLACNLARSSKDRLEVLPADGSNSGPERALEVEKERLGRALLACVHRNELGVRSLEFVPQSGVNGRVGVDGRRQVWHRKAREDGKRAGGPRDAEHVVSRALPGLDFCPVEGWPVRQPSGGEVAHRVQFGVDVRRRLGRRPVDSAESSVPRPNAEAGGPLGGEQVGDDVLHVELGLHERQALRRVHLVRGGDADGPAELVAREEGVAEVGDVLHAREAEQAIPVLRLAPKVGVAWVVRRAQQEFGEVLQTFATSRAIPQALLEPRLHGDVRGRSMWFRASECVVDDWRGRTGTRPGNNVDPGLVRRVGEHVVAQWGQLCRVADRCLAAQGHDDGGVPAQALGVEKLAAGLVCL